MELSTNISSLNQVNLLNSNNVAILSNDNIDKKENNSLINKEDILLKLDNFNKEIKENIEKVNNEIKKFLSEGVRDTDSKDAGWETLKKIGLGLLGLVLGGALAFATFNIAMYPISFVIQLLVSSGLPLDIPQQIVNLLQTVFGLSVLGAQYGAIAAGAYQGSKSFSNLSNLHNLDNKNNLNNNLENAKININELMDKQFKESLEKFKNSESIKDYIRNGFNVGVKISQKISEKSGNLTGILIGLGLSLALMSPLTLLVSSLLVSKIGLWGSLGVGLSVSLPLGIKAFNALKDFSKNVFQVIGGAIGGAVGSAVGVIGKTFNSIKSIFKKKDKKERDEFTENSPYKNEGLEKLANSVGKSTFSFVNGVSDFAALSSVITELLSKEPNGLQFIGKLVSGTIKSYQGASILKLSALENKPELKNIGLFKFLTGFSLLASFLGPLFGPIGVLAFAILPLAFMSLEKFFEAKNNFVKPNENVDSDKKQEQLKSSYAMGVAGQTFIDSLGSLGKFWMGWDTIFGGGYGGLTSIFGIVGATKDVIDGTKMMTLSEERSSLKMAVNGFMNIVKGASLFLAAIGLGRIFGFVGLGISIFQLVSQIIELMNSDNSNKNSNINNNNLVTQLI